MYIEQGLSIFMGAFVVWGFLMAMFFNLMLLGFKAKVDLKLVWASSVMAISYVVSDHFYDFFSGADVYLTWVVYDLVTLGLILPALFLGRKRVCAGVVYVLIGLVVNSILYLSIHWDLNIRGNTEPWWLWTFYSMGINLSDLTMIVALIVDRDILGIIKIKDVAKERFSSFSDRFLTKCLSVHSA
ncbi:hypothetical protein [Pseudoalteromonas ruthenica]|uniref:hypothetical protein n=1 Tax=Pseudoalteromonas ruthenica TaxID=151081 RepID=UPI00110AB63A|nr:hypothetical protein [Pseudoalteromonas ruthenica]TMO48218.1 hypothetical protein CWC24_04550 [Pseudoalteromonas ruthenica]TMO52021.1 hypothetical protein CWC23_03635 [Pseudoalteromonas ruthenica]